MKILICDEKREFAEKIEYNIQKCLSHEKHSVIDISTSLTSIKNMAYYDVIITDVMLNHESTIPMIKNVLTRNRNCYIFFISDHKDYISQAFALKAFRFFPKNVSSEQLLHGFQCMMKEIKKQRARCVLYTKQGKKLFYPKDILYIETRNRKIKMSTTFGIFYGRVNNLMKMKTALLDYDYCQVHQSFFLNMNHIQAVRKGEMTLTNGEIVPTSILHRDYIKARLEHFFKSP